MVSGVWGCGRPCTTSQRRASHWGWGMARSGVGTVGSEGVRYQSSWEEWRCECWWLWPAPPAHRTHLWSSRSAGSDHQLRSGGGGGGGESGRACGDVVEPGCGGGGCRRWPAWGVFLAGRGTVAFRVGRGGDRSGRALFPATAELWARVPSALALLRGGATAGAFALGGGGGGGGRVPVGEGRGLQWGWALRMRGCLFGAVGRVVWFALVLCGLGGLVGGRGRSLGLCTLGGHRVCRVLEVGGRWWLQRAAWALLVWGRVVWVGGGRWHDSLGRVVWRMLVRVLRLPHGGWGGGEGGCPELWVSCRVLRRVCLWLPGHGLVLVGVDVLWERAQDAWDRWGGVGYARISWSHRVGLVGRGGGKGGLVPCA